MEYKYFDVELNVVCDKDLQEGKMDFYGFGSHMYISYDMHFVGKLQRGFLPSVPMGVNLLLFTLSLGLAYYIGLDYSHYYHIIKIRVLKVTFR